MEGQNSIPTEKMSEFLLKCIDKYRRVASILFENVNINGFNQNFIHRMTNEYSEVFDFHFINPFYMKSLYDTQIKKIRNEFSMVKSSLLEQKEQNAKKRRRDE